MTKSREAEIRKFLLANVGKHPRDLVAKTMKKYAITRPAVHLYLQKLINEGEIIKEGERKSAQYFSAKKFWTFEIKSDLQEDLVWQNTILPNVKSLPPNVINILRYGATEIINNSIDHSEGSEVAVGLQYMKDNRVQIAIIDDGIGIFKKIAGALNLTDIRESILHLTKGKFTTDEKRHSGEGIFFTSRSFDQFSILSEGLTFMRFNNEDDWFFETRADPSAKTKGTVVLLTINMASPRELGEVFAEYQDPESHSFNKTSIFVQLAKLENEDLISRSQAKRLLSGLEKFKTIILDFTAVKSVGQGFVDEVFRVYKNNRPDAKIKYVHANPDVEFMIKRGLATTST